MSLDQLLAALSREAEAESQAVLSAARAEAEQIRARCDADLAERRRRDRATLEAERKTAVESSLVAARLEARGMELAARERMLTRVLDAARARLPELRESAAFREALPALVTEALAALSSRSATLRCHPALIGLVKAEVGDRSGVTVVADPEAGSGFRLTTGDGTLAIDATLEDRLARMGQQVRQAVVARLEPAP